MSWPDLGKETSMKIFVSQKYVLYRPSNLTHLVTLQLMVY
jgi:hypothetical protein